MKKIFVLFICLFSASIVFAQGYPQHVREIQKVRNLVNNLSIGTLRAQVTNAIGHPDKIKSYVNASGKIINVILYLTDDSFSCITEHHEHCYTPLIFEEGVLIGKGQEYLDIAIKRYRLERQF